MPKYRKLPVVVEAMQFTDETKDQCFNFVGGNKAAGVEDGRPVLKIQTLNGITTAKVGDWVIKDTEGGFYPCVPEHFEATYEPVDDP